MAFPLAPAPHINQARRALTVALAAIAVVAGVAAGAASLSDTGGPATRIDSSTDDTAGIIPSTTAPDPVPVVPQVPTTAAPAVDTPVDQPVTAAVVDTPDAATPAPTPAPAPVADTPAPAPAPEPAPAAPAPQSPPDTSGVIPPHVPDTTPPPSPVVDCDIHPVPEGC